MGGKERYNLDITAIFCPFVQDGEVWRCLEREEAVGRAGSPGSSGTSYLVRFEAVPTVADVRDFLW